MTIGNVIAQYRKDHNMSMDKFAEASGLSKAYISILERNRTPRGSVPTPSIDTYKQVANALGIDVDELIRMVDGKIMLSSRLPSNLVPLQPMKQIPLLGQIACGTPILAAENIEEYIDLPHHIKADYALTCKGDSMIGAGIQDGDVVYIRKQEKVENGQIAAVMVGDEEATLKRFYFDGTVVQLVAENPRYSPKVFVAEDAALIHVIGLAVAFTHAIRHYS